MKSTPAPSSISARPPRTWPPTRAALDALVRAGRTLSTAAGRLTDDYYPATRAAEVTREAAALDRAVAAAADPEVSNDSDRTDAALDELIFQLIGGRPAGHAHRHDVSPCPPAPAASRTLRMTTANRRTSGIVAAFSTTYSTGCCAQAPVATTV